MLNFLALGRISQKLDKAGCIIDGDIRAINPTYILSRLHRYRYPSLGVFMYVWKGRI